MVVLSSIVLPPASFVRTMKFPVAELGGVVTLSNVKERPVAGRVFAPAILIDTELDVEVLRVALGMPARELMMTGAAPIL